MSDSIFFKALKIAKGLQIQIPKKWDKLQIFMIHQKKLFDSS